MRLGTRPSEEHQRGTEPEPDQGQRESQSTPCPWRSNQIPQSKRNAHDEYQRIDRVVPSLREQIHAITLAREVDCINGHVNASGTC